MFCDAIIANLVLLELLVDVLVTGVRKVEVEGKDMFYYRTVKNVLPSTSIFRSVISTDSRFLKMCFVTDAKIVQRWISGGKRPFRVRTVTRKSMKEV